MFVAGAKSEQLRFPLLLQWLLLVTLLVPCFRGGGAGPIPTELGRLARLEGLAMASNDLTGVSRDSCVFQTTVSLVQPPWRGSYQLNAWSLQAPFPLSLGHFAA